jgi:pimeloyl-ACP methyl ester carboxylesterase
MLARKVREIKTKITSRVNPGSMGRNAGALIIPALLLAGFWSYAADQNGHTANNHDFSGLVDIGNGLEMYLECLGAGSPTVVYIAGGFEAGWISKYALYSTDLVQEEPVDAFSDQRGDIQTLDRAVFPTAGKLTRVCNYDRPNTTLGDAIQLERGGQVSTPVTQPHTVEQAVADLHTLLTAAHVPGRYVLVGHSYGGLIAELYASTYPEEVSGRVHIDVTTAFLLDTFTAEELKDLDEGTMAINPNAPDAERLRVVDAMKSIRNAPAPPRTPVFLLSRDKPPNLKPESLTLEQHIRLAHDMLAEQLCAKYMKRTNSGHHIFAEQPQLVNDAVREVVEAARNGCTAIPCEGVPPKTDPSIVLPDCARHQ